MKNVGGEMRMPTDGICLRCFVDFTCQKGVSLSSLRETYLSTEQLSKMWWPPLLCNKTQEGCFISRLW